MHSLLADIRYGVKMLLRKPAHTALAILALSLGIGLVATMFSVVNGFLLRGLPYEGSGKLVYLEWRLLDESFGNDRFADPDILDIMQGQTSFEGLVVFDETDTNLSDGEAARRCQAVVVTSNFLDLLRVEPLLGRGFTVEDEQPGSAPVAMLSFESWKRDFEGAIDVVSREVNIEGEISTIIGVMPQGFDFPDRVDIWMPLHFRLGQPRGVQSSSLEVVGRLKDGLTPEAAEAELAGIASQLAQAYPATNKGLDRIEVHAYLREVVGDYFYRLIWAMQLSAFFVLLIACANVANLVLASSSLRGHELAIRSTLGASRSRIIAQMLTESLVLSFFGAMGGILVAMWGVKLFWYLLSSRSSLPLWLDIGIDGRVLIFVVGVTVVSGLISGIVPALQASRTNINDMLKDSTRTSSGLRLGRFNRFLVTAQLALSGALLIGAGLMTKSILVQRAIELPYDPSRVMVARFELSSVEYPEEGNFYRVCQSLIDRVKPVPGVESVAVTDEVPFSSRYIRVKIDGESYGSEDEMPGAYRNIVSNDYFNTYDVSLVDGRPFGPADTADSLPVAIVNTNFAQKHWPNQNPLGKRFYNTVGNPAWMTVIGVAPDMQMEGLFDINDGAGFYTPISQLCDNHMMLILRGQGNPMDWVAVLRREMHDLNPNMPLYSPSTVDGIIEDILRSRNLFVGLYAVFGLVAVILSAVGVFGVVSFAVNQRVREFGVRMALGAQSKDILNIVFKQTSGQLLLGLVFGLILGYGISRLIQDLLFEVSPVDPLVYFGVVAALAVVAVSAVLRPALRASRLDPLIALRYE